MASSASSSGIYSCEDNDELIMYQIIRGIVVVSSSRHCSPTTSVDDRSLAGGKCSAWSLGKSDRPASYDGAPGRAEFDASMSRFESSL